MKKTLTLFTTFTLSVFLNIVLASAHVVIKPDQVGVGALQTFTANVPVEKETPTVGLKLMIPEGVEEVMPNVKPGWKIDLKKDGNGDNAKVTEIDWTGGNIPVGQRDEFIFSAQVPAQETTLKWKVYQIYQSGEVVAWDQEPKNENHETTMAPAKNEDESFTPYSVTTIINDLKSAETKSPSQNMNTAGQTVDTSLLYVLSTVAIILSILSLGLQLLWKK